MRDPIEKYMDEYRNTLDYEKAILRGLWHYPSKGDMPQNNKWVLVLLNDDTCTIGLYCSWAELKWIDNYENEIYERDIVSWMPLPEPSKEET